MSNSEFSGGKASKSRLPIIIAVIAAIAILGAAFNWRNTPETTTAANGEQMLDVRGRPVTTSGPVSRIAIDDSRYLVALGLVHPEPVSLLAAWPQDVHRLGAETYQQLLRKSPRLAEVPKIASSAGSFDLEALLAAKPDVALISLESGVTDAQIAQVEGAGIPVIILDFFVKPFENLEKSLTILGHLTGREEQAQSFIAFRAERMERIASRIASLPKADRPTVFLETHAGMSPDCCNSPGQGNIGDYINFVGGHNIGADVISQAFGKLNLEYVVSRDPEVYIATGGPHLEKAGGLVLGAGYDEDRIRASLQKVASRRGISDLSAVRSGRVHGFSHQLINSPIDIVAIETFAKWIHPELFEDIDPSQTLEEINNHYLSVPYSGIRWISLREPE